MTPEHRIADALERIADMLEMKGLTDEQRERLARQREDRVFDATKEYLQQHGMTTPWTGASLPATVIRQRIGAE